ncbi:HD-GYP domain-containing protein [Ferdinandcohnia sp. SAFN-114]|uniref:HD-GYP domain-containing protein n=1 Tax=Ferdinandcohnia sp. SAFN-114 TaxID=3387275 RepID=UPI003F807F6B
MKQLKEKTKTFQQLEMLFEHDIYTFQHSLRVAELLFKMGIQLNMSEECQEELYQLGALHDIGKIRIPQTILNKEEHLTEQERKVLNQHTIYGFEILRHDKYSKEFLDGVIYHHENYDGTGYPYGISSFAEGIPVYAQILRVVDSFDAMTSNRSYKKAFSVEKALAEIESLKGIFYSPEVVDSFISMYWDNPHYLRWSY